MQWPVAIVIAATITVSLPVQAGAKHRQWYDHIPTEAYGGTIANCYPTPARQPMRVFSVAAYVGSDP